MKILTQRHRQRCTQNKYVGITWDLYKGKEGVKYGFGDGGR